MFLNVDDTEEPLILSHQLIGWRVMSFPYNLAYSNSEDENFEVMSESLQKRTKNLNNILLINNFWKQWSREYLLDLRKGHCQQ